jgi:hypothetical protein
MHKNATKCNKTQSKWCKNKHGASKIIDTFETYQPPLLLDKWRGARVMVLGGAPRVFATGPTYLWPPPHLDWI